MKKYVAALLCFGMFSAGASPVVAQMNGSTSVQRMENGMERREQRKENVQQLKASASESARKRVEQRCKVTEGRVSKSLGTYNQNYPQHVQTYQRISTSAKTIATNARQQGKDPAALEASLVVLDEKVRLLDQQASAVVAQLKVAEQYVCGQAEGQYKAELQKARDLAKVAHKSILDIRAYYQNTVRVELKKLTGSDRKVVQPDTSERRIQILPLRPQSSPASTAQ